jgi:hypothetical protein
MQNRMAIIVEKLRALLNVIVKENARWDVG